MEVNQASKPPGGVTDQTAVVPPPTDTPSTLEQRLARFDPAKHGGEAMACEMVGAER